MTLGDEEGRKLELYCVGESLVMVSYLYSLDLPGGELASMPIAREYHDVFEEAVGLPLHREIEFRIDLVKDVKPVVLPLRRMAPREQRELEAQTDELLRKGFI